ncbi:hypothetical protein JW921_02415 [Candidatus Fermentibacterales bacterium]|nr:hypothetical protein [Candidatus Fermentibacterales bacterium]
MSNPALSDGEAAGLGISASTVLYQREGYLLARVRRDEGELLAEVTRQPSGDGNPAMRMSFPEGLAGIVYPSERHKLPDGGTVLLYQEKGLAQAVEEKPAALGVDRALSIGERLCTIIRRLHENSHVLGYVGPEMLMLDEAGKAFLRAGRAGVPRLPFSAPEAIGSIPRDPRSDVFALGTLMFRLIAGSDERGGQIETWNALGSRVSQLIEKMVAEKPADRHPNLVMLARAIEAVRSEIAGRGGGARGPATASLRSPENGREALAGLRKSRSRHGMKRRAVAPLLGAVLVAAVLVLVFVIKPWSCSGRPSPTADGQPADSTRFVAPEDSLRTDAGAPDSITADPAIEPDPLVPEDEIVIWVSNYSGRSGEASSFRTGVAGGYSQVYPSTGQGLRSLGAVMCRRADPFVPLEEQDLFRHASLLAARDSSEALEIRPVDITIMLGTDLSHAGTNESFIRDPVAPACTLFVDVVNCGLQYTLDGLGAAAWLKQKIDGRAISVDGSECLLSVTDVRDGDRSPNEELGLPVPLQATLLLYNDSLSVSSGAEQVLRSYLQAVPDGPGGLPEGLPVPDIWVLLGSD